MSLKIWLPLNGSTINQGTAGFQPAAAGITYADSGKVGAKSCSGGSLSMPAEKAATILNNQAITIAFWIKPLTNNNAQIFGNGADMGANNNRKFSLWQYPTGQDFHWSWMNDAASDTFTDGLIEEAFPLNTWTHLCITYNNPNVTVYINGEKKATSSGISNSSTFAYDTTILHSNSNRNINDFRIYDHCLSPREVKLLAQGLVAHYKLDDPRINNLAKTAEMKIYDNHNANYNVLNPTGETYLGSPIYRLALTPTEKSLSTFQTTLEHQGVHQGPFTFAANTKYCYWIYYKPISHQDVEVGGVASNNPGQWTELPSEDVGNGWYRVGQYRNGTVTEAVEDCIYTSFRTKSAKEGVSIEIDFCAPHLLAGPTNWVECPYTISNSGGVEYDCSGYGNHATISGTVGCALRDSPRYQNSYIFNGNAANRITNTTTQFYYTDNFTWSCWVKHKYPDTTSFAFTVGRADYSPDWGYGLQEVSASSMRIRFGSSSYIVSLDENNWHHLAFTKSGNNISVYVDGVPANYTFNGTPPAYTNSQGLGIGCFWYSSGALYPFYGRLSDFRIYATALSAAAVKELYESSISFLDNGTLQCSEIVEKPTNIKYNKNGIVQTAEIEEANTNLKLHNNKIQTFQIYEL